MNNFLDSNFLRDFFFGGTAGIIAKTIAAPLERIKLLLQTQDSNHLLKDKKYTGFFNCTKRILLEEGALAFWRGNSANVIRYFPTSALNFAFKDYYRRKFNSYDKDKNPYAFALATIMCGGLAGASCMMFVYPLDLTRTRMGVDVGQAGSTQYSGIFQCMRSIHAKSGITGLYSGLAISIPSIFLYRALYFGIYDIGKEMFPGYKEKSLLIKFAFAQFVTTSSETLSYPMDTIRRRMMMNSGLDKKLYNNTMHCINSIITQEGYAAFFKGNMSNILRSLSSSLVLVLYDEIKNYMNDGRK